jgi:hypothetical protein
MSDRNRQETKARLNSPGGWGQVGSDDMLRYFVPTPNKRRRCRCGCKGAKTHIGMANGVALMSGCEFAVRRWVSEK